MWGIPEENDIEAARKGIQATVEYFRSLHMPVSIGELETGILKEEELLDMARRATGNDSFTVAKFKELHQQDVLEILRMANH